MLVCKTLTTRLKSFRDDSRGSVSVEFIIMIPMVFWAFMASYVFFDGYRQSAVNVKAAYTVSDLISRETDAINNTYLDSMYTLHRMLTRATSPTTLRVSVVRWDEPDNRFYLDWSHARGNTTALTDSQVLLMANDLPAMPNAERVIIVETTNTFVPLFGAVMDTISLDNFVFTRPRFAPQVVWES